MVCCCCCCSPPWLPPCPRTRCCCWAGNGGRCPVWPGKNKRAYKSTWVVLPFVLALLWQPAGLKHLPGGELAAWLREHSPGRRIPPPEQPGRGVQVQHLRGSRPRCTRKEPATARAAPYPLYIGQREEHRCVLSQRTAWMLFLGSRFPGQAELLLVSTSRPQPPRFPHRRVGTPWAGQPQTGPGAARGSQGCPGIFLPCQIPRPSREEQHPALQLPPPRRCQGQCLELALLSRAGCARREELGRILAKGERWARGSGLGLWRGAGACSPGWLSSSFAFHVS